MIRRRDWWPVAIGAWSLTAGLLIGWRLLADADHGHDNGGTPTEGSAEVGFARDMSVHHAQAVQMADIIRGRTLDERMRILSTDIVMTQQNQIGRMQAWLENWDVNPTSLDPPMAWMGSEHGAMAMNADGQMPGMATSAELAELTALDVPAAEIKFLQLMVAHHYAGVAMAQHATDVSDEPAVDRLADSMVAGQYAEIASMGDMLRARGVEPPSPPPMPEMHADHDSGDQSDSSPEISTLDTMVHYHGS